ncbi:MAG: WD40 repeat domain-containing protein [Gammaproteobacteria bacterium]|nr:WD40 repeat domain-containing protein [Gammaproteobacteria bacterium]
MVLEPMVDFSKLPYHDDKKNHKAGTAYLSEEIVSHPFRDKHLRLEQGVHLHWALPDALTQGVNTEDGLEFPIVPDRWLVTRSRRDDGLPEKWTKEKQWIVESDYLHPEGPAEKQPENTVTFPLPPRPEQKKWQPYRFLGRKWVAFDKDPKSDGKPVSRAKPENVLGAEYLNALQDGVNDKTHWHHIVSAGLTAIGYGEPSFAAFYPNCQSVFGLHDDKIKTSEEFSKVRYDVIGWYDTPALRDGLRHTVSSKDSASKDSAPQKPTPFENTCKAIALRINNEHKDSGYAVPEVKVDSPEVWREALEHHYGWSVPGNAGKAERMFCYATLERESTINPSLFVDPLEGAGSVDIAVGNTGSEALSAFLANQDVDDKSLLEEQLEGLNLGHRLEDRLLDIGPKFREARHENGFKSVRSGILYTIRPERVLSSAAELTTTKPVVQDIHAQMSGALPSYIGHALNELNLTQARFQRKNDEDESLRLQIYHDWTLYMRALRPPDGLEEGYPDPVEIARFIEKTGLNPLRSKLAEIGELIISREKNGLKEGTDTPIAKAEASKYNDDTALASQLAIAANNVIDGLTITNRILQSFALIDHIIADSNKKDAEGAKSYWDRPVELLELAGHTNAVNSARFDATGRHILTIGSDGTFSKWDAHNGQLVHVTQSNEEQRSELGNPPLDSTGKYFVTTSDDKTANVWDAEIVGEPLCILSGHDDLVTSASFDPTGQYIVTASGDKTAKVWDAKMGGKPLCILTSHEDSVISASFDLTGKYIITASEDQTAKVWDAKMGGEPLCTLTGHEDGVMSAGFDSTGQYIVTASSDKTAKVWDAKVGGKPICTLTGHEDSVNSASFDSTGKYIVTASDDGTVKVWIVSSQALLKVELSSFLDRYGIACQKDDDIQVLRDRIQHKAADFYSLKEHQSFQQRLANLLSYLALVISIADARADVRSGDEAALRILESKLKTVLDKYLPPEAVDESVSAYNRVLALKKRIQQYSDSLVDIEKHNAFHDALKIALSKDNVRQVPDAAVHYVLRQIDAPRYYQPTDPVVLMAGASLKPTERHGTDNKEGKLECRIIPDVNLQPVDRWKSDKDTTFAFLKELEKIRTVIHKEKPDGDQIGARVWKQQPWHPFLMEWEAEMHPVTQGSNREENRFGYASGFVAQNYSLPESCVDLRQNPGATVNQKKADSGLYSGRCVLIDKAPDLLRDKLKRYLDKADDSAEEKTESQQQAVEKLRAVNTFLEQRHNTLSQSLSGFHEALLQRHQILQLPIIDPIGFSDLKPFTDAVRDAARGRHSSSPLRGNDFTPIRSGTMKLRQLRLVDTFGRVKQVLAESEKTPIITSETLSVADAPNEINLPPRLLQPARINFRWLSAEPAPEVEDEPESNVHPATTPVCGWILPNNLDSSLLVYDNKGAALGSIVAIDGSPTWQPSPGSELPRWEIEKNETARMNPHLRKLINTIVNELGKQDNNFFTHFISSLNNALETISPEDFSHHDSLALLMGRPMAVVRAMVNLELRGQPAVNQSLSAFIPDMMRAIDPQSVITRGQADAARTTDDFCHVRFPIRIGEDQQLNDGLVGYFLEENDGRDYHYKDNLFCAPQAASHVPLNPVATKDIQELVDQLNERKVPIAVAEQIKHLASAVVTIDKTGHRWRIDTLDHVYNLVRSETGIDVFELLNSSSKHIQTHWKEPVNLMQSVHDASQKLTMLIDPQGSVHAVSGILPTKSITLPTEQYVDALQKLEVTFLSTPVLTEQDKIHIPLAAEAGYQWSWLTRRNEAWVETDKIERIDTHASFSSQQRIVEGWLKLTKEEEK